MAVRLAFTGQHSLDDISELAGMGRSRVVEWIRRFRTEGVHGLKNKPRGDAKAGNTRATPSAVAKLIEGLNEGRRKRAEDVQRWAKS